jgi:hypothetical protein
MNARSGARGVLIGFIVGTTVTFALPAMAVDPTVAGNTEIGTHPSYGSLYSAFWRTGDDYSLLTEGNKTYINAPSASGAIYFRGANAGVNGAPDPDGWHSRAFIDGNSNLMVGNTVYGGVSHFSGSFPLAVPRAVYGYMDNEEDGVAIQGVGAGSAWGVQGTSFNGIGVTGNSTNGWGGMFGQDDDDYYNYGIFVAGLTQALQIFGKSNFYGDVVIVAPPGGFATGTGSITVAGNVNYGGALNHTSDQRVKKDIADFGRGLADLERVHVVSYRYNGLGGTTDDGQVYVGVVAQELEKVLPFMVSSEKMKLRESDAAPVDLKRVDTGSFTYLLVNAVKELARQNKELLAQNAEQDRKLAKLAEVDAKLAALAERNEQLAQQNRALATLIGRRLGGRSVALAR